MVALFCLHQKTGSLPPLGPGDLPWDPVWTREHLRNPNSGLFQTHTPIRCQVWGHTGPFKEPWGCLLHTQAHKI